MKRRERGTIGEPKIGNEGIATLRIFFRPGLMKAAPEREFKDWD